MLTNLNPTPLTRPSRPSGFGRLPSAALLLAPGMTWMTLCLLLPIAMMVYVSFWTQTTFTVEPTLTTESWVAFFTTPAYLDALLTTVGLWLAVLACSLLVGYPVALYIGLFVRNKVLQTTLLVLVRDPVLDLVPDPHPGMAPHAG